ncbi:putative membrane protein [Ehrlichia chaffeensis str. Heartland]|nr:putative membrane protein [Ehrlichia chaffeensis str. Heartland]AHX05914.1 putative membrane protein [Ehrlichia chaffeensis str. Jax]AHX06904.1 putative membrane protein [Ehrlichia chaffeensis str. Liberty]AHX07592.1 putative membrane protein [Ehrlichia chaffeensis str. Osceola]AHX08507.1 putative membrane protein [Ehrlichia chaffeensis str. Saint Vincent]AHX09891.1 putative membrane protein [Ehrlichia chaffeensis str. Wakulla]AHX10051.1 putative membrane protein [Ehrlichia chaffeensis str
MLIDTDSTYGIVSVIIVKLLLSCVIFGDMTLNKELMS